MENIKVAPIKPVVSFDIFEKIDIRVGTIVAVDNVEGADNLVKLIVDFGDHIGWNQARTAESKGNRRQAGFVRGESPVQEDDGGSFRRHAVRYRLWGWDLASAGNP
jgi:hypothetical protein